MNDVMQTFKSEKDLRSNKIPSSIREKVETAVENQGYRVTVGDVSGRAGVTLNEAEDALQALAADSLGSLEVSSEGEVVYVFPKDFRLTIRSKSLWIRMEPAMQRTRNGLATLGRIAFGVFFVAVVIAVSVAVIAVSTGDKDRDRSSSSSSGGGGRVFFNVLDIMRIMNYTRMYNERMPDPEEMSFVESVYSYMFGDGDPNKDFEDRRWNIIGQFIRSKRGVVVAEELAPYLDLPEDIFDDEDSIVVDEGYMLPVLTRFQGEPIVSSDGTLIYAFPKFQTTGVSGFRLDGWTKAVPYLQEEEWKFSKATAGKLFWVLALAVVNAIGVGILSVQFPAIVASGLPQPGLWFTVLCGLQVYAASFFAAPLTRWFLNKARNSAIAARNKLRLQSFQTLRRLTSKLNAKLKAARSLGERKLVREEDVIYSSAKDLSTQATEWEEEEFNRRLSDLPDAQSN